MMSASTQPPPLQMITTMMETSILLIGPSFKTKYNTSDSAGKSNIHDLIKRLYLVDSTRILLILLGAAAQRTAATAIF